MVDPQYQAGFGGISPHYQVQIKRKGAFPAGTGGNYTVHVAGPNARVNLHSTDKSTNIVIDNRVFADLRAVISEKVPDERARLSLLNSVDDMAAAKNDKPGFLSAYQRFISNAAEHMTVIAPFLPALAPFLG